MASVPNIFCVVFFVIVLASVFHSGEFLECFQCNSKYDSDCKNLGGPNMVGTNCTPEKAIENHLNFFNKNVTTDNESSLECARMVGKSTKGDVVVIRSCLFKEYFAKECEELLGKYLRICESCSRDNCNGAIYPEEDANSL